MSVTAIEKLQPQLPSDQQELFGDVDISQLELFVSGNPRFDLRASIVQDGATVERTIDGASTVVITVRDRDRTLTRSGLLDLETVTIPVGKSKPAVKVERLKNVVDIRVDGLVFRLVAFRKIGEQLELTFEDRDVALLRSLPKLGDTNAFRFVSVTQTTRALFALRLIQDVKDAYNVEIPFVCPALPSGFTPITSSSERTDQTAKDTARAFGFAPDAHITVKGEAATATQRENIARVVDVGVSMVLPRKLIVAAVMTVTTESRAINLLGGDADSRGMFQQQKYIGGKRTAWPASRDIEKDAKGFYDVAVKVHASAPNLNIGRLCDQVQRSYTVGTSQEGANYNRWHAESDATVTDYGIGGSDSSPTSGPYAIPATTLEANKGFFTRGTGSRQTKRLFKREDDWACLQRLGAEVGWRAFCVSGIVYLISDADLFASRPRMTIDEQTVGVDDIDFDIDTGQKTTPAQAVVYARIRRWGAPPGSVVKIADGGPVDGRWLVSKVSRSLFSPNGTVTLTKPQPTLAESSSPEFSGATVPAVLTGGATGDDAAVRDAIVAACLKSIELRNQYRYAQVRPMPKGLFAGPFPEKLDCSSHATLAYKEAGAPDPNGLGYNGVGNTGSLAANGRKVAVPAAGDLVFFGGTWAYPDHVAIYLGGQDICNMGSPGEPVKEQIDNVPLELLGYMRYTLTFDTAAGGQDRSRHGGNR